MLVFSLKILGWTAVYIGAVLLAARFCATNTITEEREERAKERSAMV
jgi:hypothetical protein